MKIVSRAEWGARKGPTTPRPLARVSWFLVHYHGGPPPQPTGPWVPKNIEAIHLNNGWQCIGYHFAVDQAGTIYEGRGWDYVGAHSPVHNTDGIGVYVAVGGTQEPTEAAKRSVRWLYDEANRRTGKTLRKSWHGYDYPTECPGPHLIAWVKAGMPVKGGDGPQNTPTQDTGELTMSQYEDLKKRIDAIAADVKAIKSDTTHMPKRVWSYRIDTPKSVSNDFKSVNKAYSAGGLLGYNLLDFMLKGRSDKILAALDELDKENK